MRLWPALLPRRAAIARLLCLGHPVALGAALLVGLGVHLGWREPWVLRSRGGRETGERLAATLDAWVRERVLGGDGTPSGGRSVRVWIIADGAIEARPDVLLAMSRSLHGAAWGDLEPVVRWTPGGLGGLGAGGAMIALCRDDDSGEETSFHSLMAAPGIGTESLGKYGFAILVHPDIAALAGSETVKNRPESGEPAADG